MTDDNENFLNRWSRRKQSQGGNDSAQTPELSPEQTSEETAPDGEDAALDPATLPDIDSLDKESDFTVFMQDGVPEELRVRALRKLWTTDPVLANLDGLNDYDEDFGAILKAGAKWMQRIAAAEKEMAAAEKEDENEGGVAGTSDARPAEEGSATESPDLDSADTVAAAESAVDEDADTDDSPERA